MQKAAAWKLILPGRRFTMAPNRPGATIRYSYQGMAFPVMALSQFPGNFLWDARTMR